MNLFSTLKYLRYMCVLLSGILRWVQPSVRHTACHLKHRVCTYRSHAACIPLHLNGHLNDAQPTVHASDVHDPQCGCLPMQLLHYYCYYTGNVLAVFWNIALTPGTVSFMAFIMVHPELRCFFFCCWHQRHCKVRINTFSWSTWHLHPCGMRATAGCNSLKPLNGALVV